MPNSWKKNVPRKSLSRYERAGGERHHQSQHGRYSRRSCFVCSYFGKKARGARKHNSLYDDDELYYYDDSVDILLDRVDEVYGLEDLPEKVLEVFLTVNEVRNDEISTCTPIAIIENIVLDDECSKVPKLDAIPLQRCDIDEQTNLIQLNTEKVVTEKLKELTTDDFHLDEDSWDIISDASSDSFDVL